MGKKGGGNGGKAGKLEETMSIFPPDLPPLTERAVTPLRLTQ